MGKKNRTKHGFTLAELAVVLAVLAVASAMVVTFTVMVGNSRRQSAAKLEALQSISQAESLIEGFLAQGNAAVSGDGKKLVQGVQTLYYADGQLVLPNTAVALAHVTDISFKSLADGKTGDALYFCTVAYTVAGEACAYTFCVDPVVGEQLGGGL